MAERGPVAGKIRDAEQACGELRTALKGAGITLPSMAVDVLSLAEHFPLPLVELGDAPRTSPGGWRTRCGSPPRE
ncbi:hypothetical protein AB0O20_05595 [Streptomyces kronopolitis]|uniref:hypothetical protein n=1 Tax=Streptomyces kronopolitis TaxID=1612435 RepID=UPI0034165E67